MHTPVLLSEVLTLLAPRANQRYLDLTAGYGGHAGAILAKTGLDSGAILVDRDEQATTELQRQFGTQLTIWQMPASQALRRLADEHAKFDLILADIGVSSPHLDNAARGFSFMSDGPLDMRMDRSVGQTAADLVNHLPETELADLIWRYGEERQSRRIAKALVGARPLATTKQLADVILHTVGRPPGSHHPATKTFQALRIAVNDELGELQAMLSIAPQLLNADGRLAIISFHSLEDRLVKQTFADLTDQGYEAEYAVLTKKPLTASSDEIAFNPRSRSAKLRGLVKINKKG